MRHSGGVFDAWEGKYPTFKASRKELIRMYIRLYRTTVNPVDVANVIKKELAK